MKVTVNRKAHFSATHRLHNPHWSDAKNKRVFGLCNNPNYHGHNYDLIVSVTGEVDPETGYVMDMKVMKETIEKQIISRFDHKNLYLDVDDFVDLNPTAENMVVVIWNLLRTHFEQVLELKVTLFETERNFVEYDGKPA